MVSFIDHWSSIGHLPSVLSTVDAETDQIIQELLLDDVGLFALWRAIANQTGHYLDNYF